MAVISSDYCHLSQIPYTGQSVQIPICINFTVYTLVQSNDTPNHPTDELFIAEYTDMYVWCTNK